MEPFTIKKQARSTKPSNKASIHHPKTTAAASEYPSMASGSEVHFEYNPLRKNEIRLLKILPTSEVEEPQIVSCPLILVSLQNLPVYAALSYAWGNEEAKRKIIVNGGVLLIRPNLDAFLREMRREPILVPPKEEPDRFKELDQHLSSLIKIIPETRSLLEHGRSLIERLGPREKSRENAPRTKANLGEASDNGMLAEITAISRDLEGAWDTYARLEGLPSLYGKNFIWIDAMRINQTDLKERSEQVKLMQNIYKGAKMLVFWLGQERNGSSKAIRYIDAFGEEFKRVGKDPLHFGEDGFPFAPIITGGRSPAGTRRAWIAVVELLARPWFRRAWVLQEFTLGGHLSGKEDDAIIYCCGQVRTTHLI
jgi:hypothetical protein